MKHLSWKYRKRRTPQQQREFCAAQSRRVMQRWERVHATMDGEPVRKTHVVEMIVLSTHAPMRTIRLQRDPRGDVGWSRWSVTENGVAVGDGGVGTGRIAMAIAESLR